MRAFSVKYTQFLATKWSFLYHVHSILELHNCVIIFSQHWDVGMAARCRILIKSSPSEKNRFSFVTGVGWVWFIIMTFFSYLKGWKKLKQVHTTRLFESSQKTKSKLIKWIFKSISIKFELNKLSPFFCFFGSFFGIFLLYNCI